MQYQTLKKGGNRRSKLRPISFHPNPRDFGRPQLILEDEEKFIIFRFESWQDIRELMSQAGQLSHDFDEEG